MRATRAYLAGFGTAGSLVAGAAVMFVLASAIIGFHGWPQVGSQSPISNVTAQQVTIPPSSRASRILAALSGRSSLPVGLAGRAAGGAPQTGSRTTVGIGAPGNHTGGVVTGFQPNSGAACTGSACAATVPAPTPNPPSLTSAVSQTVAQTGAKAGSSVTNVSNGAANAVAPVAPGVAKTIKKIGHGASQTVTAVTSTTAGVVSQAGSTVSGLTHHLAGVTR